MQMHKKRSQGAFSRGLLSLIAAGSLFFLPAGEAQEAPMTFELNGTAEVLTPASAPQTLKVPIYKSRIIQLRTPVKKVSVGNERVADILVLRSRQIYVLGQGIGSTNVLLWDQNDRLIHAFDVEVSHDLDVLKAKLHELLPGEQISVYTSNGNVVLSGEVTSPARMDTAMQVAKSYVHKTGDDKASEKPGGGVLNMMTVGGAQQVMLKVQVAEMSRTLLKRMGIKFHAFDPGGNWQYGAVNGGASFPDAIFGTSGLRTPVFTNGGIIGPAVDEFAPGDLSIADKGLFASFLDSDFLFSLSLEAAKNNGQAKILAEPTLTTLTGEEAEFLSGGEFPIPVPRGDDGITIEFKEFGVGLKFLPVVLNTDRINLNLNISVSELVSSASVTVSPSGSSSAFVIPSLTKRGARSTVELGDGQTIAIAGLINENMREVVNKFPGLGDIPILGQLFRSQEFEKGETELVILVTPHLAKPLDKEQITLPTDNFVEPSDFEFYLLGVTGRKRRQQTETTVARSETEIDSETTGTTAQAAIVPEGDSDAEIVEDDPLATSLPAQPGRVEGTFGHSLVQ